MKILFFVFAILVYTGEVLAADVTCGLTGSLSARIKECNQTSASGKPVIAHFKAGSRKKTAWFTAALDTETGKVEVTGGDDFLWEAAGKTMSVISDLAATRAEEVAKCRN